MKKLLIICIFCAGLFGVDRNLDIMPNLNENPSTKYSTNKNSDPTYKVREHTQERVKRILSSDMKARIKAKLKALHKKINSKQHHLKLKQKARKEAIKKSRNHEKTKRVKKAKKMLKRLRGSIHTTN